MCSVFSVFRTPLFALLPPSSRCEPALFQELPAPTASGWLWYHGFSLPTIFEHLLRMTQSPGGGGHSREVWVEVCHRGLPLFETKTSHFATLFKTGDITFWLWFVLFCIKISHTKILEIGTNHWYCKCRPLIASLHTLWKASSPKTHLVQDA